jgi:hypothetical protein
MEHVARMGEDRKVYKVLVGEPQGKRPLRRPRHRSYGDWLGGGGGIQDRDQWQALMDTVINIQVLAPRS